MQVSLPACLPVDCELVGWGNSVGLPASAQQAWPGFWASACQHGAGTMEALDGADPRHVARQLRSPRSVGALSASFANCSPRLGVPGAVCPNRSRLRCLALKPCLASPKSQAQAPKLGGQIHDLL